MNFEFGDCVVAKRNNANYYGYVISIAEPAVMVHYFHDVNTGYKAKVFHAAKVEHSDWDNGWGESNPTEKQVYLDESLDNVLSGRIKRYIYDD